MSVLVKANRSAVDAVKKECGVNLAQIAAALVAKRIGGEEHLDASGGLSESGRKAIKGLYVWKAGGGGVYVTRGRESPEPGASLIDNLSQGFYEAALRAQLGEAEPPSAPAGRAAGGPRWHFGLWTLPLIGPVCSVTGLALGAAVGASNGDPVLLGLVGAVLGMVAFVVTATAVVKRKDEGFSVVDLGAAVISNSWAGLFVGGLVGGIGMAILSQTVGRPTGPLIAAVIAAVLAGATAGAFLSNDLA